MVEDLGIPVKGVNWVRLHAWRAGDRERVLVTMGQQAENLFVLSIDPETGAFTQHVSPVKKSQYPTATLMSRSGHLYIGAAYAGHLLRFDPSADRLDDLGAIHPEAATFPCRIDEDSDGVLWIGSYGGCDLTTYDPKHGTFTNRCRADETDMYLYPFVGADDTVACRVGMTRPHVRVYDRETGAAVVVGPVTVKGEDTLELYRTVERELIIRSSKGNFRVQGTEAVPIDEAPEPPDETVAVSGGRVRFSDADAWLYRELAIGEGAGARRYPIEYDAAGSDIFVLHEGPDGGIYGSSILPEHLFRFDPRSGETVDYGKCSESGGEAYSMANLDGKLYIASYPAARLSVYDPEQPYAYGTEPGANPRDVGRMDEVSYRPRSAVAGPDGKVWTASLPDYGMWGGRLSWYDPASGETGSFEIAGEGSCYTLAWIEANGLLAVGTTTAGGSGTTPKAMQAPLLLFDYSKREVVGSIILTPAVHTICALHLGRDGRVYGLARTDGEADDLLFRFDPATGEAMTAPLRGVLDLGLQASEAGALHAFTSKAVWRVSEGDLAVEKVGDLDLDGGRPVAGPVAGGWIYFGAGHRLKRIREDTPGR